jgi:hypothetical protein
LSSNFVLGDGDDDSRPSPCGTRELECVGTSGRGGVEVDPCGAVEVTGVLGGDDGVVAAFSAGVGPGVLVTETGGGDDESAFMDFSSSAFSSSVIIVDAIEVISFIIEISPI